MELLAKFLSPKNSTAFQISCIKEILKVETYSHGGMPTPTRSITVEHEDPVFASNLVNELIKEFFAHEKKAAEDEYQKLIRFI